MASATQSTRVANRPVDCDDDVSLVQIQYQRPSLSCRNCHCCIAMCLVRISRGAVGVMVRRTAGDERTASRRGMSAEGRLTQVAVSHRIGDAIVAAFEAPFAGLHTAVRLYAVPAPLPL